jgi:hypothetical protein
LSNSVRFGGRFHLVQQYASGVSSFFCFLIISSCSQYEAERGPEKERFIRPVICF